MPKLFKISLLDIGITVNPKAEILEYIKNWLVGSRDLIIVTPNPEQVVYAHSHHEFAKLLNSADIAIPDGVGIIYGLKTTNKIKRIPGVELMRDMVKMAVDNGYSIGLVGGKGDLAFETFDRLAVNYKELQGFALNSFAVSQDGIEDSSQKILRYFDENGKEKRLSGTQTSQLIAEYQKLFPGPLFIFVGLGAPKQEFFISRLAMSLRGVPRSLSVVGRRGNPITDEIASPPWADRNDKVVLMSVGGAFEMLSGQIRRAPVIIRSLGLEWLWRLILEPWRWRRQLALLKFLWLVWGNKGK